MNNERPTKVKSLSPESLVKSKPLMYWGAEEPSYEHVNSAITRQLKLDNCTDVEVAQVDGWHVIATESNCFVNAASNASEIRELFKDALGFPIAEGNSLRYEYFLNIIASDVFVFFEGELIEIKGQDASNILPAIKSGYSNKNCICYKFGY